MSRFVYVKVFQVFSPVWRGTKSILNLEEVQLGMLFVCVCGGGGGGRGGGLKLQGFYGRGRETGLPTISKLAIVVLSTQVHRKWLFCPNMIEKIVNFDIILSTGQHKHK